MKQDPEKARQNSGPRSVLRVLDILQMIAAKPEGASLTELCVNLELPKTSTFSLLKALEGGSYITQRAGKYVLGIQAFHLGISLKQPSSLAPHVRPIVEWLSSETQETILLAVVAPDGRELSYVDVVDADHPQQFTVRIGNRRPFYCAAAGLALLAFLPLEFQQRYIAETTFVKFTADTADRDTLIALLPEVRRRGVVLDANGIIDGTGAAASPGFDSSGQVVCAISIAGPTSRLLTERDRFEGLAVEAGRQISERLGYRGAYPAKWPT
jgi:DNA-binding IclR family transcriptional regulator